MNQPEAYADGSYTVLLAGVVGSRAYGMATPESDEDRLGVVLLPTQALIGLDAPKDTWASTSPDVTMHELGKFLRLALKANPTILDLLWLDEYDVRHPAGDVLVERRADYLSTDAVRRAFGGYAMDQARALQRRGDPRSPESRKRIAKHARHCFRALRQGEELLRTGTMSLRVPNRDELFALGDSPVDEIVARFHEAFAQFSRTPSILPETADRAAVNALVLDLRHRYGAS
ncbi:MAG: nucleotidyltransferase domain-containing protein [Thermomicrobiales bacterium]